MEPGEAEDAVLDPRRIGAPAYNLGSERRWALLGQMTPDADQALPPPRPRTKPVALRFDEDTLRRAKTLASRRGKGYQTLLKEFISERLYEEEKREGLVGPGLAESTGTEHQLVRSATRSTSRPRAARKPSKKSDQHPET